MPERRIDPLTGQPYRADPGQAQLLTPYLDPVAEPAKAVLLTAAAAFPPLAPLIQTQVLAKATYEDFGSEKFGEWTMTAHKQATARGLKGNAYGKYIHDYILRKIREEQAKLPPERRARARQAMREARSRIPGTEEYEAAQQAWAAEINARAAALPADVMADTPDPWIAALVWVLLQGTSLSPDEIVDQAKHVSREVHQRAAAGLVAPARDAVDVMPMRDGEPAVREPPPVGPGLLID